MQTEEPEEQAPVRTGLVAASFLAITREPSAIVTSSRTAQSPRGKRRRLPERCLGHGRNHHVRSVGVCRGTPTRTCFISSLSTPGGRNGSSAVPSTADADNHALSAAFTGIHPRGTPVTHRMLSDVVHNGGFVLLKSQQTGFVLQLHRNVGGWRKVGVGLADRGQDGGSKRKKENTKRGAPRMIANPNGAMWSR